MSVNVIAELHPLRSTRTKLTTGLRPIADIIGGLNSGFPLSHARACLNGEIVRDFSTIAHDGDTLWVKFVPYGDGGGMKAGGWALALAGVVVTIATWGTGSPIGVMLIGSGIGMIAGGTVLMNMNVPSLKDRERPEQDPSIRGGKNQARPHGRIPVLFGRHRLYPDLAANPFTSVVDDSQYYTQLFCGGYRDCAIDLESVKLGETPLAKLSQSGSIAKILALADPLVQMEILQDGEASRLYPCCVHEDAVNAPLQHEIDDGDGGRTSGEITRTTPDNTDTIGVDFFFYNGLGRYNDKGDIEPATVEVRASYKKTTETAWRPLGYLAVSGAELRTRRCQITGEKLARGAYDVKVERVTSDSTDAKVIDQVHVGSIRATKSERPIGADRQKDLTIIALRVMATAKVNGIVDSFNYVATSLLPSYSGTGHTGPTQWLGAAPTRNPAAMLLYALKGRAAQQGVDDGDIDWPSLERFHDWCGAHEYYCDAYLSESVPISALFGMIGSTARAEVLRIDSKISVVQDIVRGGPAQLFTPKNTKGYSVTMLTADIPDALLLRFVDGGKDSYAENSLTVYDTPDGNRAKEPETTQTVDLWGVTGSAQARRIGMYSYGVMRHRPFVHTIEVDIEYLLCNKGDWVQYAGDLALAGSTQGRVRETIADNGLCAGFLTDEPIEMEAGRAYGVRVRKQDGTVMLENVRANAAARNEVEFLTPMPLASAPAAGDIYAFGVRGEEAIDLIITDIQPQADLSATLTCVEYSPGIFGVDSPGFVLPDFQNKISPVRGAADGGAVEWGLHETYHDGDAEPTMPTGDGQGGGWHRARTAASVWASSKRSPTAASGAWGPPVRLKGADGRDGLGIDAIPRDPWAYWSCDDFREGGPLLDDSGNGRHMHVTQGVLPAPGPGGRPALRFLGTGGALTKYPAVTFCPDGDFTWALWVNRDNAASAASQYIIGNWEDGGGGIYAHVDGSLRAKFYSGGAFVDIGVPAAKAPNNTWLHVILKYYGGTRTLAMKINNVEERRLALPDPIGWPSKAVPLALGGDPAASQTSLSARYYGLLADVAVFGRLTTEEEDEALYKTSLTKRYGLTDWLLDPANSQSAMARYTPRYRGAAAVADTGNTGTIATNQGVVGANPGDWVMFTGRAGWQYAMVYEWTGSAWRQLPRPDNAFKYLDGVSDLADGVPDGVFADVFCRALWAQQAFIDQLRTRLITLESPGAIESKNFIPGSSGFRIRHDGEAEFTNGIFRGRIEADEGFFHGELIATGNSNFQGVSINVGPLVVKPEGTTYNLSYNSGTSISTILNDIYTRTNRQYPISIITKSGTFNGKKVLLIWGDRTTLGNTTYAYSIMIMLDDNTAPIYTNTIPSALSFSFEYGDIIFKLVNLPTYDPKVKDQVWREGTTLKISNG